MLSNTRLIPLMHYCGVLSSIGRACIGFLHSCRAARACVTMQPPGYPGALSTSKGVVIALPFSLGLSATRAPVRKTSYIYAASCSDCVDGPARVTPCDLTSEPVRRQ